MNFRLLKYYAWLKQKSELLIQVYFDKTSCHNNGRHRSMPHKQRDRKRK